MEWTGSRIVPNNTTSGSRGAVSQLHGNYNVGTVQTLMPTKSFHLRVSSHFKPQKRTVQRNTRNPAVVSVSRPYRLYPKANVLLPFAERKRFHRATTVAMVTLLYWILWSSHMSDGYRQQLCIQIATTPLYRRSVPTYSLATIHSPPRDRRYIVPKTQYNGRLIQEMAKNRPSCLPCVLVLWRRIAAERPRLLEHDHLTSSFDSGLSSLDFCCCFLTFSSTVSFTSVTLCQQSTASTARWLTTSNNVV